MTTIETALEILQQAITEIDAKQWKEIKQKTDPIEIVAVAAESQALMRIEKEIRKKIESLTERPEK